MALIDLFYTRRPTFTPLGVWVSVFISLAASVGSVAYADDIEPADTIALDNVVVKAYAPNGPKRDKTGAMSVDAGMYRSVPRMFGEADMLRLVNLLPGVTSTSDYAGGATIDGSDFSQHMYRVNDVPVLFPYHFGGIFSTLNSYIYPRASVHKSVHPIDAPSVAGAVVDVWSDTVTAPSGGEVNVGLLATSLGVRVPLGRKVSLRAGGRISYISKLYAGLLRGSSTDILYDFGDADLTLDFRPSEGHMVSVTAHYNDDFLKYSDDNYDMLTRLDWHNLCAGVKWAHQSECAKISVQADYSQTGNRLLLEMTDIDLKMPTVSRQASLSGVVDGLRCGKVAFSAGSTVTGYFESPQHMDAYGFGEPLKSVPELRKAVDSRMWGRAEVEVGGGFKIDGGIDLSYFSGQKGYGQFSVVPRVSLMWNTRKANFLVHAGGYRQPVHYVGLSEIGLASNFRYAASRNAPIQNGWHFAASGEWRLFSGELSLIAEMYCKFSQHQAEYVGNMLDLLDSEYDVATYVRSAKGRSYGASVMLKRSLGAVTGWISYNYGFGQRKFYGENEWFTATGSISHSLKANLSWRIGSHWNIGGVFTFASGRPYTPVKNIYVISEKLMMSYGERNSARMPAYHRLDIGASYQWRSFIKRMPLEHMLSVSLINAYGHRNIELQGWSFNMESRRYYLKQSASLYRFLPSVSYTLRFGQ
ncbi:MAG: hypothetical protein K2O88_09285 [Paramuribaculum sp.]|nr:hypothetical protein [Paramuribaculum sp.]